MRKLTIAEMRLNALYRFNDEYIGDLETARHIVNIYYRLAALAVRNLENDTEENNKRRRYRAEVEKENRMYDRLDDILKAYGLHLTTPWICPAIVKTVNASGGVASALDTYFYN